VVRGADPGKYLVGQRNSRSITGHEAADVRHERDEGGLAQQSAFAAHVRPREDNDLLGSGVEYEVIRNIGFARRQASLDHRVAAAFQFQFPALVDLRTFVVVLQSVLSKTKQTVEDAEEMAVCL